MTSTLALNYFKSADLTIESSHKPKMKEIVIQLDCGSKVKVNLQWKQILNSFQKWSKITLKYVIIFPCLLKICLNR